MKKTILIILVLATVVGGCKKYEEGPCISFRSVTNRLYGEYEITSYTINGEDSLSLYCDSLKNHLEIYFDKADLDINLNIWGTRADGAWRVLLCSCNLTNDNSIFNFNHCGGDIGTGPFTPISQKIEWEILRLTKKELKMKTTYNGKEYVVDLEKK
jgi:hypothetical protein